jgi:tetratricopeptide (TPR) repeat protein
MRLTLILTVLVGALAVPLARADLAAGTFAPDIDAQEWLNSDGPVSLSELRGMVVVLYFWVTFHRGGEFFMTDINVLQNNASFGRGLMVIGLTESDRARTKPTIDREKIFFPVGLGSKSHQDYRIDSFPRLVIIDPDGKVAWSGWPGNGQELSRTLLDVLAKNPPRKTHPKETEYCREHLAEARDALRSENYRKALIAGREAFEHAVTGDPLKTRGQDMLDLLEAIGRDKLAAAEAYIDEKKFDEAVRLLRQVKRSFRGMECAREAKRRLDSLEKKYSQVADLMKGQQSDSTARALLVDARDNIQKRRFGEGYEKLETILKDYGDTELVDLAAETKQRMEKNPKVMQYVRDFKASSDCENWLAQARTFLRSGESRKAQELLKKIIDGYPNTRYSDEAYKLMAELP